MAFNLTKNNKLVGCRRLAFEKAIFFNRCLLNPYLPSLHQQAREIKYQMLLRTHLIF